jgi:hypothetical protein
MVDPRIHGDAKVGVAVSGSRPFTVDAEPGRGLGDGIEVLIIFDEIDRRLSRIGLSNTARVAGLHIELDLRIAAAGSSCAAGRIVLGQGRVRLQEDGTGKNCK